MSKRQNVIYNIKLKTDNSISNQYYLEIEVKIRLDTINNDDTINYIESFPGMPGGGGVIKCGPLNEMIGKAQTKLISVTHV